MYGRLRIAGSVSESEGASTIREKGDRTVRIAVLTVWEMCTPPDVRTIRCVPPPDVRHRQIMLHIYTGSTWQVIFWRTQESATGVRKQVRNSPRFGGREDRNYIIH